MSWAWRPQAGPQKALVECPLKEIFPAKPRHRGGCRAGVNETLPAVAGREDCDAGQPGGNPSGAVVWRGGAGSAALLLRCRRLACSICKFADL
jgi:hypothetical protein